MKFNIGDIIESNRAKSEQPSAEYKVIDILFGQDYYKIEVIRSRLFQVGEILELPIEYIDNNFKRLGETDSSCCHVWLLYIGFTDKYYYCDKCGEKRIKP